MKPIIPFISLLLIAIISFQCHSQTVKNKFYGGMHPNQLTLPILVGKTNNPIFKLELRAFNKGKYQLEGIKASLSGTQELKDIKAIRVFDTHESNIFSTQHLIGQTSKISQEISFRHKVEISDSVHYLWLSVELNDDANIDHTISLVMTHCIINDVEYPVFNRKIMPHRLGIALRQHNDNGIHTYRIPGLATTNKGTLIAVYDMRRNGSVDLQEDIDVGMNRSTDGGRTWESMKVIMDMGEWGGLPQNQNGIGDPAILVDRTTNTIWVAAVWAHGHPNQRNWWASKQGLLPQETSQFVLVKSEDDGKTWSKPINITTQIKRPEWYLLLQGPGKGITMDDGTLVFPAQFKDENQMPHSTLIYSKDHGKTWHIGNGAKSNTTEAQIVELADHSLMINMRDNRGSGKGKGTGARSVAITKDLGKTWTEHPTSRKALPEPVCMASLIKHRLNGKDMLIFSNPLNRMARQNMCIQFSADEGMTWDAQPFIHLDEGVGRGYSCLTSIDDNTIGILYESSQADLVFQRISIE
jgi:sialidase-1